LFHLGECPSLAKVALFDSLPHDLLILGASCRAAAFSALRAGFRPRCADYFADRDLAAVGVMFSGLTLLKADDDKKVTISGDAMCAKCALKETKTCQNVVIETKDGKKTTYYIVANAVAKKAHQGLGICQASKDDPIKVKVTGTVAKKDDKMELTAEKIEKE